MLKGTRLCILLHVFLKLSRNIRLARFRVLHRYESESYRLRLRGRRCLGLRTFAANRRSGALADRLLDEIKREVASLGRRYGHDGGWWTCAREGVLDRLIVELGRMPSLLLRADICIGREDEGVRRQFA